MQTTYLRDVFQPAVAQPTFASAALLLLRLIIGIAFTMHGWGKIQTPFSWLPPEAPIRIPGILQFLAALAEFGGGIALVLGVFTSLAALALAITMAVAVYTHMVIFKDPFVSSKAGGSSYEPALVYLGIAILILAVGPGRYSLDAKIFGGHGADRS
jgi:putative oxidoreductase